ncbi:DNA modification methylase [Pontimonas sp.]|nr:DNA modification methylase [Pontimonas sp.]MDA8887251.1 DNA modification methylase [Pontimonas sp.]
MRRRLFAPLALAFSVALGATGCTLNAEIATMKDYDPSDGVGTEIGELALRNIMLITNDAGEGNLVMTVVNSGGSDVNLNVQYTDGGSQINKTIDVLSAPALLRVGDDPGAAVLFSGSDVIPGGLAPIYFQYAENPGELVLVPVLDGTLPEYELLVP